MKPEEIMAEAVKSACPREDMHADVANHIARAVIRALDEAGYAIGPKVVMMQEDGTLAPVWPQRLRLEPL